MTSRKKNKRSAAPVGKPDHPNTESGSSAAADTPPVGQPKPATMPSDTIRSVISIWLPLHLFALLISFSAVVESSSLQAQLQTLLRPYLQLTHFGADDRPLYLAYGDPSEQPHRLEVATEDLRHLDDEISWTDPHFDPEDSARVRFVGGPASEPGTAVSDRYHRWLSTAATLAENDQPSLVASLLLPVVRADETIRAVRIIRLTTDLNTTLDDDLPPPYVARVVRDSYGVSLVRLQSTRLSAVSVDSEVSSDE